MIANSAAARRRQRHIDRAVAHHLQAVIVTSRASLRSPVSGADTGVSCLLTSGINLLWRPGPEWVRRCDPGGRVASGAPPWGTWCQLEAPANSAELAGGRSASTSPPTPGRSSPVVPLACHIGRSIPVPSGQPRFHLRHRRAGRPSLDQLERLPRMCLIRMRSQVQVLEACRPLPSSESGII